MRKTLFLILMVFLLPGCHRTTPYQGYVEGRLSYISANFSGVLTHLYVKKGDAVSPQQLLFILEPQPESDLSQQATAQLNEAKATLTLMQSKLQRRENLFKKGVISKEDLEQSRTDVAQAQSRVNSLTAALSQAKWNETKKNIKAIKAGFVFDTYFLPGELVPANHPVLSLLSPDDIYIVFYLPENTLSHIKLGQTIYLSCDHCAKNLTATVNYISPKAEYTPPVVYTNDRREKLVYRIEASPQNTSLHPGQPVDITLWKP